MKRIQIKLIAAVAVLSLACGLPTNIKAQQQTNTTTEAEMRFVFPIKGWAVFEEALRDYEIGADTAIKHGGKASAFARSKLSVSAARAIALRQSVPADRFRSQKIRLSGWIKGDQVEGWAGLWLRIDGDQGYRLSMDNMQNRPIKGTSDWQRYELVLYVPETAIAVSFGLVLAGNGRVWVDDLQLEPVSRETPTTEIYGKGFPRPNEDEYNRRRESFGKKLIEELKTRPLRPENLDFEILNQ